MFVVSMVLVLTVGNVLFLVLPHWLFRAAMCVAATHAPRACATACAAACPHPPTPPSRGSMILTAFLMVLTLVGVCAQQTQQRQAPAEEAEARGQQEEGEGAQNSNGAAGHASSPAEASAEQPVPSATVPPATEDPTAENPDAAAGPGARQRTTGASENIADVD